MHMTSKGLQEMFKGDFADTRVDKFPLVSMGAEQRVKRVQTREQGPPSAPAEIRYLLIFCTFVDNSHCSSKNFQVIVLDVLGM